MFLAQLQGDKHLQNLFPQIPDLADFELHKVEVDLQRNSLTLTLHTPLLPTVIPKKEVGNEFNYSCLELKYFSVKNFRSELSRLDIDKLHFTCDTDQKTIQALKDGKSLLSFQYEEVRLGQWNLYQNDI